MRYPAGVELPEQLRGDTPGTFTTYSVTDRLPEIAIRTAQDLPEERRAGLVELAAAITKGRIEPVDPAGPETQQWTEHVAPYVDMAWTEVPWFFAEYYFYRRVLDAVGYWTTEEDPYGTQKQLGLAQGIQSARSMIADLDQSYAAGAAIADVLGRATDAALWGNRADLSLWPAESDAATAVEADAERLLTDHRSMAVDELTDRLPPPVAIVLDNVGAELVADLILADILLRSDVASRVVLDVKTYPVFVSDGTTSDVTQTIDRMSADPSPHMRSVGERLAAEIKADRLRIRADPFWVSPVVWRQRPASIDTALAQAGLVIVKGDANFRRLVDDRAWEPTTPFSVAIGSSPAPLLSLRTLKSEVVVGLDPSTVASVAADDADWMVNGKWATALFAGRSG